ncbi:HlyU family transcriptional regulator [Cobetia crustatorum]|uniref:HlyU family transcriptional regulator n=1 Tax=Cobetia crustatorum TaxID=553385 RepID=UPI0004ACFB57|nr:HlyU family transcriptional regulator [Cobetia crustatorum]
MLGMLKKLFSAGEPAPVKEPEATEYNGYLIVPIPQKHDGQYRVSGLIRKPLLVNGGEESNQSDGSDVAQGGGEMLEHRFERSDTVPSEEGAVELTLLKARRTIDDLGDSIFTR